MTLLRSPESTVIQQTPDVLGSSLVEGAPPETPHTEDAAPCAQSVVEPGLEQRIDNLRAAEEAGQAEEQDPSISDVECLFSAARSRRQLSYLEAWFSIFGPAVGLKLPVDMWT